MATSPTTNPAGSPKIKDVTPAPTTGQPAKPQEFARFEGLTSKLMQVPKDELDGKVKQAKRP